MTSSSAMIVEGSGVKIQTVSGSLVLNWAVTPARKVVQVGQDLLVYLLDRNEVYNYWVLYLPNTNPVYNFTDSLNNTVIVKAGYLLHMAAIDGKTSRLIGDLNKTTMIEAIGVPSDVSALLPIKPAMGSSPAMSHTMPQTFHYQC